MLIPSPIAAYVGIWTKNQGDYRYQALEISASISLGWAHWLCRRISDLCLGAFAVPYPHSQALASRHAMADEGWDTEWAVHSDDEAGEAEGAAEVEAAEAIGAAPAGCVPSACILMKSIS